MTLREQFCTTICKECVQLHGQVEGRVRATVVSLNSMLGRPAGALGMIALTALADRTSASTAMYLAAAVLAVAAPLYLPACRQQRALAAAPAAGTVSSGLAASDPA